MTRLRAILASRWTTVALALLAGALGLVLVQTAQHLRDDHDSLHVLIGDYLQRHPEVRVK